MARAPNIIVRREKEEKKTKNISREGLKRRMTESEQRKLDARARLCFVSQGSGIRLGSGSYF